MNKILFTIIISILTHSCVFTQFSREPSWVKSSGKNISGYYVGFGSTTKKNLKDSEYIAKANEAAFLDISNQINVNIYGETKTVLAERGDELIDESEFTSESSSLAELEGLIKENVWQSKENYYVLWKLSKKEHKRNIDKYAKLAETYFENASNSVFSPVEELGYLVKGYESILRAHGKIVRVESQGRQVVLNSYFFSRIEEIISKISTRGINSSQNATFGKTPSAPLIFNAIYKDLVSKPISGLPVKFVVTAGEIELDINRSTDFEGNCSSLITEIKSDFPNQEIIALIDLSVFKLNPARNAFLDRKLEEITKGRSTIYRIKVTQMVAEKIAVKIIGQEGLPAGEVDFINEKFIAELKKLTDYTVIERALMGEVLEANEFNAENCSTDECQVQIGRILAVRKMIYVLLWKYGNEYNGTVKLVNIESGENEHSESVSYSGNVTGLVRDGVPKWIRSFYTRLNTAKITFTTSNPSIELMINGDNWGRLPIFDKAVDQGKYKIKFSASGYEGLKRKIQINLGQQINQEINLKPKSRFGAFSRSLFFPGRGQWYSADQNHNGRRFAGLVYSSAGAALLAGSLYLFNESTLANQNYLSAKNNYLQATLLEDIEAERLNYKSKHQESIDAKNTAIGLISITASLWIWNAIDAAIFFPSDYQYYSFNPRLESDGKNIYAGISFSRKF